MYKNFLNLIRNWIKSGYFLTGLLVMLAGYVFIILTEKIITEKQITHYDQIIFNEISKNISSVLTLFMIFITKFGAEFLFLFLLALLIFFLKTKQYEIFFLISSVTLGGSLLVIFFKNFISRSRPVLENSIYIAEGFSYPSGHTAIATCFYGILIYLVVKCIKNLKNKIFLSLFLAFIIILVGFSRIYLGVHYPTDILAGYCLGIFWTGLCIIIYKFIKKSAKKFYFL